MLDYLELKLMILMIKFYVFHNIDYYYHFIFIFFLLKIKFQLILRKIYILYKQNVFFSPHIHRPPIWKQHLTIIIIIIAIVIIIIILYFFFYC